MLTRRSTLLGCFALPLVPSVLGEKSLPWSTRLVRAARKQIGVTRTYDPAYVRLAYPMGDVPRDRGVCTDVIIRAYRDAFDIDLQAIIHEDMKAAFTDYPANWGLSRPDRNIDHRRVPNLERYFERKGLDKPFPASPSGCDAGDLYTMRYNGRLPHIGIVSDRKTRTGEPLVIHNMGWGTSEDDIIGRFGQERRFRYEPHSQI
ncbi:hypothetical protein HY3_05195 [Hyphomonas pacifica]|uniref:Uncharacterized protein n=2 Tax=Hyphomonas pacifica TaxID=1280941 RepID=A0A062U3K5_9PROT|nr:DUF1287 domain-containing protein [Hyphomonas pacifica]KCZ50715.1 hypothetical protein HY2_02360 [Hyphomonas pacifica]RAN30995.1 hypothetical protein HY3_05195 [Hyphomonas pacifica]RAN34933.1 hypothetical protein HY11_02760 [Hyphomonas pacifica]